MTGVPAPDVIARRCPSGEVASNAYLLGSGNQWVQVKVASIEANPINAAGILETAAVAPLLRSDAPVPHILAHQGELALHVNANRQRWCAVFHERVPNRRLLSPHSRDEYQLILDGQDQWAWAVAAGPVDHASWLTAPIPFDGLDEAKKFARVKDTLPTYAEWRVNHGHRIRNFARIGRPGNLRKLVAMGLSEDVAGWVRRNFWLLRKQTMKFYEATAGDHLVNGQMSGRISMLQPTGSLHRVLWSNYGQLTVGHPMANYMFAAIDQHHALLKANRADEWSECEQMLLTRLARLGELGAPVQGWQLNSFAATYLGQFLASGLRELPPEVKDPEGLRNEWFALATTLTALCERWKLLPDGDIALWRINTQAATPLLTTRRRWRPPSLPTRRPKPRGP